MNWTSDKRKLSELIAWEYNPRDLTPKQKEHLTESIKRFGQVIPFSIGPDNQIYDGHQRKKVMELMADLYGPDCMVDVRVSERELTYEERRELVIRLHENTGDWDFEQLANLYDFEELEDWGFNENLLETLGWDKEEPAEDPGAQIDKAEELREKWGVESGQLWQLGEHRVICGDCTDKAVVDRLMGGEICEVLFTDPPYSSGGNQESGKVNGSIGARGERRIKSDNLSTRGYRLLMSDAVDIVDGCHSVFIFCDWKMWIETFDLSERCGYRVRNMIVWDKVQMGMGMPFRNQHELILFASKIAGKIGDGKTPNVISCERDRDASHITPKPIELIEKCLEQVSSNYVYDPFIGGGSTLIACERLGRKCYGVEIEPKYVAVTLERWHEMTGETPVLLGENSETREGVAGGV